MTCPRPRHAVWGAVLAASLAASLLPGADAAPAAALGRAPAALDPLTPTALTLHGGRNDQELGRRLNVQPCDLNGDGLGDVTAVGAAALGAARFVDMAAARRTKGHADALTDLPQWSPFTTDGPTGWTCAGDVNGDDVDDLVQVPAASARVVAVDQSAGSTNEAGRLTQHRVRNYTFPVGTRDLAATAAGPAGDVDGDGVGDVVVSQHTASTRGRTANGRLWVLTGERAATVPQAPTTVTVLHEGNPGARVALTVDGASSGDRLDEVVGLGDVTGDGVDDLAVASTASGRVWLVHGRTDAGNSRELDLASLSPSDGRLLATQRGGRAGTLLGAALDAGDVDGDGVTDLVIGLAVGLDSEGGVAVVRGGGSTPAVVDLDAGTVTDDEGERGYVVRSERPGDGFGHAVAVLGDQDGDGRAELLVGAPGHDPLDPATGERMRDVGAAYVLRGRAGGAAQSLEVFADSATTAAGHRVDGGRGLAQGDSVASRFGQQVAAVGDVDGNGADDFAVGAPGRSDHATSRQGAVTVALRGELGSSVDLAVSRRLGDDGEPLAASGQVVAASDVLDLRAGLRLSTVQGLAGTVQITLDGQPLPGCEALVTEVEAPHRSFAHCEDVRLTEVGEHSFGATHAGVAGHHSGSVGRAVQVLVTDATSTSVVAVGGSRRAVRVQVLTATGGTPVTEGTVDLRTADGTVVARGVALTAHGAVVDLPDGVAATGLRADYSGVLRRFGGDEVTLLGASSGTVAAPTAPRAAVQLSRTSARLGDTVTATLVLDRTLAAGRAELLVDGTVVGSTPLTGQRTPLALPARLPVGRREVEVRTTATGEVPTVSATAVLSLARARAGRLAVSARPFVRGSRPRVAVRLARASDGRRPGGTLTVSVGGARRTVQVRPGVGRVVVKLPGRHRAATASVTFRPYPATEYAPPRLATVRLRPRS